MLNMEYMDDADRKILMDFPDDQTESLDGVHENHPLNSSDPDAIQDKTISAWSFKFYQRFFDVDTAEVWLRIQSSIVPRQDFLADIVKKKPDLYGPIWINITLILLLGWTSDLARCFIEGSRSHWRLAMLTWYRSSFLLFLYNCCLPTTIWIALEWDPINANKFSLAELFCLYGYANAVFLPMTIFCSLPWVWVKWTSAILATSLSGALISRSLKKGFYSLDGAQFYVIVFLLLAAHFMVGMCLVLLSYPSLANENMDEFDPDSSGWLSDQEMETDSDRQYELGY
ncbi:unnamed protein product [Nesidiocoris tenuis]|uniref:Protein YIPF n=1 Tax=Nesidiocoris tenuis TaxID=355587 RepID=A0A6H5G9U2_9HEMI|nr:unnamed protein product [Nesidiocoris tenuis]